MNTLTVSVKKAGELTGLGRTTLFVLLAKGRLTRVKVGRRTLILTSSIETLLGLSDEAGR